jgi:FAD/FMN-containing dehydrogenase
MPLVSDLTGLNATEIPAMPVAEGRAAMKAAVQSNANLSVAGMRHSQGGQTTFAQHPMLLTEAMDSVTYNKADQSVTADCGATWSAIQHVINEHGRALLVQQSSAHFSVGGSLAVNCHGRDARQGPLSSTVRDLELLLPDGRTLTASPTGNGDLFYGAIGGYGACGIIVRATFRTTENFLLQQVGKHLTVRDYGQLLRDRQTNPTKWPDMHYGWLNFTPGRLYEDVLSMDYRSNGRLPSTEEERKLHEESWATSEGMRGAWHQARTNPASRTLLWNLVVGQMRGEGPTKSRINWQRAPIAFTLHKGTDSTDLLQEYFVPLDQFENMVGLLKNILERAEVTVLSTTVRVVQADADTFLSYCGTPMVSLAVDVNVPLVEDRGVRKPAPSVGEWVSQAIDAAIRCAGSFYLPYYRFATRDQFHRAYSAAGVARWRAAAAKYNPQRRLNNDFLSTYL